MNFYDPKKYLVNQLTSSPSQSGEINQEPFYTVEEVLALPAAYNVIVHGLLKFFREEILICMFCLYWLICQYMQQVDVYMTYMY